MVQKINIPRLPSNSDAGLVVATLLISRFFGEPAQFYEHYDSEIHKLTDRQALRPNDRMVSTILSKSAGAIADDASLTLFVITPHCQRIESRSWRGGILSRGRYLSIAVRGRRVM